MSALGPKLALKLSVWYLLALSQERSKPGRQHVFRSACCTAVQKNIGMRSRIFWNFLEFYVI